MKPMLPVSGVIAKRAVRPGGAVVAILMIAACGRSASQSNQPPLDGEDCKGLAQQVADADWQTRAEAASSLGDAHCAALTSSLVNLLEDQESYVRYVAASALTKLQDPAAEESLASRLKDGCPYVRGQALEALIAQSPDRAFQRLVQLSRDDQHQRFAAYALGIVRDSRAEDLLLSMLDQHSPFGVDQEAARSLGKIGSERAVQPLVRTLITHRVASDEAAEALVRIGPPSIGPLIDVFRPDGPWADLCVSVTPMREWGWN